MTPLQIIERLDELEKRAYSDLGTPWTVRTDEYRDSLVDAYSQLRKAVLAGEKAMVKVKQLSDPACTCKGGDVHCIHSKLAEHCATYHAEVSDLEK